MKEFSDLEIQYYKLKIDPIAKENTENTPLKELSCEVRDSTGNEQSMKTQTLNFQLMKKIVLMMIY